MNGKIFVGQKALSLTEYDKSAPISGVILWVDDENCYEAGDDTGTVIEQDCPYATQQMANNLLATLQGYSYQGLEASGAKVSPIAELGDGLTVDGLYTQLAYQNIRFSTGEVMDVAAPGSDETLHEYKTEGQTTKQFTHQIAETKSLISKTAEEIRLEVESELNNLSSSFTVQLDSIQSEVNGLGGQVSTISQTVSSISSTVQGLDSQISSIEQKVDNITLSVANGESSSVLTISANGVELDSATIRFSGMVTFEDLSGQGTTEINGANLITGTVTADNIQGRYVDLLDSGGDVSGTISIEPASASDEAIRIESEGGMALDAMGGTLYFESQGRIILSPGTEVNCQADLLPGGDNRYALGYSQYRWTDVYAVNGTIQTSDATQKNSIEPLPAQYVAMLDQITPKRYKLNDGRSGRYHVGFIAQDVEAAMNAAGISDMEFAGWIKDIDAGGNAVYMLRYNEFMAILLAKIKELEQKLTTLEGTS